MTQTNGCPFFTSPHTHFRPKFEPGLCSKDMHERAWCSHLARQPATQTRFASSCRSPSCPGSSRPHRHRPTFVPFAPPLSATTPHLAAHPHATSRHPAAMPHPADRSQIAGTIATEGSSTTRTELACKVCGRFLEVLVR